MQGCSLLCSGNDVDKISRTRGRAGAVSLEVLLQAQSLSDLSTDPPRVGSYSLGAVDPVLRLFVLRVVNLLWRVDGRVKILQDAARLLGFAVDEQLVATTLHTCIRTGLAIAHQSDATKV